MTKTLTTVVCSECRKENEPERVYCHDCGARLDRKAVLAQQPDIQETRKHVKKLFDPRRERTRALFFKIAKVVLGAVALAGLVQVFLPPDVPAPTKTAMLASQIRFDLEGAAMRHSPAVLQYSDEQVNAFLGYALKTKQAALNKPLLEFNRAIVTLQENNCTVTLQRSFFGYPIYTRTCTYTPTIGNGKVSGVSRGASIGRLRIHALAAPYLGILFEDVRSALDRELKLVGKLGGIQVHDKSVVLTAVQAAR